MSQGILVTSPTRLAGVDCEPYKKNCMDFVLLIVMIFLSLNSGVVVLLLWV